jgi:Ca2+-binding RTX toxin-like protein
MPNFTVEDRTTGTTSNTDGTPNTVSISNLGGQPLTNQYVNLTTDNLTVTSLVPNTYIKTGSGNDIIFLSGNGGNIADGGSGSNTIYGGSGNDGFEILGQTAVSNVFDVINNLQPGDVMTVYGVVPRSFNSTYNPSVGLDLFNKNAAGYDLTVRIAGYDPATSSPIHTAFGTTVLGETYMNIWEG